MCAGLDWAKDDHVVCVVGADGEVLDRFTVTHTAAGLKTLIARLLAAGVRSRSASSVATGRSSKRCWRPLADRVRDQPQPGQEPARALRLGRQQGRPVRRLRPGRRRAHRPATPHGPDQVQPSDPGPALGGARPPRPGPAPGQRRQPAPRAPADRLPRRRGTVRPPRLRGQPHVPRALHQPDAGRLADHCATPPLAGIKVGYSGKVDPEVLHARLRDAPPRSPHGPTPRSTRPSPEPSSLSCAALNTQIETLEPRSSPNSSRSTPTLQW